MGPSSKPVGIGKASDLRPNLSPDGSTRVAIRQSRSVRPSKPRSVQPSIPSISDIRHQPIHEVIIPGTQALTISPTLSHPPRWYNYMADVPLCLEPSTPPVVITTTDSQPFTPPVTHQLVLVIMTRAGARLAAGYDPSILVGAAPHRFIYSRLTSFLKFSSSIGRLTPTVGTSLTAGCRSPASVGAGGSVFLISHPVFN
ncbi:hypothetical protein BC834DRAFT_913171 [Gloeopeniophorella convolvens]|nr:hypothetical protein BC834DRAFT_913171 [Gloeopeniophorella convolvens]